ncbi:MAG TPA: AAA family ATPase, partial [Rhodopila sp.]|nr:AAA family ATPase [Rhodopila sp.]
SGKTTLALRLASQLKRPIVLLIGDAGFDPGRVGGQDETTQTRRLIDRYASKIVKVETQTEVLWRDRALAAACAEGCTLIYDDFNRAPAAANNVLLTVLEERLLILPRTEREESYSTVHPEFRAIFTSNPEDHAGAGPTVDALTDRMITLDLDMFDRDREISIVASCSGLKLRDAARVVDIVRDFRLSREYAQRPTLRASIMIARIAASQVLRIAPDDPRFVQLCLDVLGSRLRPDREGLPDPRQHQLLIQLIDHFCDPRKVAERGGAA